MQKIGSFKKHSVLITHSLGFTFLDVLMFFAHRFGFNQDCNQSGKR